MVSGARARASLGFGLAALVFGVPVRAEAGPPLTLEWNAPAGCPAREVVLARVEQLTAANARPPVQAALSARAFVSLLRDGRFRAELVVTEAGAERSRVLEAATCDEIAEASAVVLALAAAPGAEPSGNAGLAMPALDAAAEEPATPTSVSPPEPARDDGKSRSRNRPAPVGLGVVAGLGAAVDFAIAADAAPGVVLAGAASYGRFAFGLRGSFFPQRASSMPADPGQGVDISLLALAPLACVAPFTLPVELAACAEFELGYLHARGYGTPEHYERGSSWLAPGLGFGAAFPRRGRLRSHFGVDVLVPLARTDFVITNVGVAHHLPAVDPRLGLRLEVAFP